MTVIYNTTFTYIYIYYNSLRDQKRQAAVREEDDSLGTPARCLVGSSRWGGFRVTLAHLWICRPGVADCASSRRSESFPKATRHLHFTWSTIFFETPQLSRLRSPAPLRCAEVQVSNSIAEARMVVPEATGLPVAELLPAVSSFWRRSRGQGLKRPRLATPYDLIPKPSKAHVNILSVAPCRDKLASFQPVGLVFTCLYNVFA